MNNLHTRRPRPLLRAGSASRLLRAGSASRLLRAGWLAAAAAMAGLSGCGLVQLRDEARAFESATVLAGRVECAGAAARTVVVAALPEPAAAGTGHHTRLHTCGGYELVVPPGRYRLVAFDDRNDNGRHDAGEALAERADAAPVAASGTGVVLGLDLVLPTAPAGAEVDRRARALGLDTLVRPSHSTAAGAMAAEAGDALGREQGLQGYWAPMSFFRRNGGTIYFTEPYDPQRVPVLFVHGAAGSPEDFAPLLAQLDRRRYQAWVFSYPSGASLDAMAYLLYWKLLDLQLRHRFAQLAVVAHSMGGLVVRQLLVTQGPELVRPRLFVSISTPWGGEPGAELGVRHSPAVVPSWHDMRPEGPFLAQLFQRPLPAGVDHVLLFGHKGGYSLMRPNTDGTVTLASMLRPQAQAQARRVVGFDEDHMSILASPQVARMLGTLLDQALQPPGVDAEARLRVQLDLPPGHARGLPTLRLRPLDGSGTPLTLTLSEGDEGRALDAVPPGRYEAALLAAGFAAHPPRQTVVVAPGQTASLRFELAPQGALAGFVADADGRDAVVAGSWLQPHAALRIQRLLLRGPGVERELRPCDGCSYDDAIDRLVDGRDTALGALFNFVGLPAGTYELLVEADGREPHRSTHRVEPGRVPPQVPLLMRRR